MALANTSFSTSNSKSASISKEDKIVNYVTSNELVEHAWKESCNAYRNKDFSYNDEHKEGYVFIAFSGFQKANVFRTESDYGECEINQKHFPWMNDGDVDDPKPKPALVRKVFLDRFLCMQKSTDLHNRVETDLLKKKRVIFTGHSFGGAIASLWTLSVLQKRPENPPFCITFGCPLVGDKIFAKAVERENWSPYFCHIVSKHDIVPRTFFSSFKLKYISDALDYLLPYWQESMETKAKNHQPAQESCHQLSKEKSQNFVKQVIGDASQIVAYENEALNVGPANLVGGKVKSDLIKWSPYRPFGCYVFSSSSGTACYVENRQAILQMLYFALENNRLPGACIMEHIEYDKTLDHISRISGKTASYTKITKADKSLEDVGLALQMESMSIGIQNAQAWIGLKSAQDKKEKQRKTKAEQAAKLENMEDYMAKIEWYKISCEGDGQPGYYDCFKTHKTENLKANKSRRQLGVFWDNIIELVEKEELPEDFQTEGKWITAGNEYRLLVEPLDIAHYYRFGKHGDSGHYVDNGRPRRYKFLEKWFENDKQRKGKKEVSKRSEPPFVTQDSCFWAYVEQAAGSQQNVNFGTEDPKSFQERVKKMLDDHEISADALANNSSFMIWWNSLKEEDNSISHYLGMGMVCAPEAAC